MAIDGRGRKIDEEKESCAPEREGERERDKSQVQRERKKIVKKIYAHATVPVHICTGTVACVYNFLTIFSLSSL